MINTNRKVRDPLRASFTATGFIYIITSIHHYYGAIICNTPWRKHVVLHGGVLLLLAYLFLYLYRRSNNRMYLITCLLIISIVFFFGIGIFEGGYNHLLKDIFFFSGMNMHTWRMLYPAPTYEIPDNFLFESTGILQFLLAIVQFIYIRRTFKTDYIKNH